MSVIVYKDGVMAADTGAFRGNFLVTTDAKKILRIANGNLVGCAGFAGDIEKFQVWAMAHFYEGAKPEVGENFGAIVVSAEGTILEFDHKLEATDCSREGYASEGDAQEFCFALHCAGFSAEDIVFMAIQHCVWAAGEVYSLRVEDEPEVVGDGDGDGPEAPFDNLQGSQGDDLEPEFIQPGDSAVKKFLEDRGL